MVCYQAYVQYMRFARRAEGIKAARTVFKLAREDTRTKFHVYIAAALMEYYCSKVDVSLCYIFVLRSFNLLIIFLQYLKVYKSKLLVLNVLVAG